MDVDSFHRILEVGLEDLLDGYPLNLEYFTDPIEPNNEKYMAALTFISTECETHIYVLVLKMLKDGILLSFDRDLSEWKKAPITDVSLIYNDMSRKGEADFFYDMSACLRKHLYMLPDWAMKKMRQSHPLIQLYKRLHGLASFGFIVNNWPISEKDMEVILLPDDDMRLGGAVSWDGKKYHLFQYMSESDDIIAYYHESIGDYEYPPLRRYRNDVLVTSDADMILRAVRFMRDRYYGGEDEIFTFPLSMKAFAEGKRPYKKLQIHTYGGPRELNKPEQEALGRLKKHFHLRH